MRFAIHHQTRYDYSSPVFLERHVFRLKPQSNVNQRLLSFDLRIDPSAAGISPILDLDGNEALAAWFGGSTEHLTIESVCEVETLRANPFDYLWQGKHHLPLDYSPALVASLGPYLDKTTDSGVRRIGADAADASAGDAQSFPATLTRMLHERLRRSTRPEGAPLPPIETLRRGEGSCRDIAMLFLAAARSQGFAGRFVSGYYAEPGNEGGDFDLHAWAELYIPGGGWRGFDPTVGLAVAERHVSLAVGARPEQAAPVSGSFRGGGRSTLSSHVSISEAGAQIEAG